MTAINSKMITAILQKDSKDSTYKFALLRALVQCVTEQRHHIRFAADESAENMFESSLNSNKSNSSTANIQNPISPDYWISYPMGLLVYYWLMYYYPIFAHIQFIPQKNGESRLLESGKTIAFRREFNVIIDFYRHIGGHQRFRIDLVHNTIPKDIKSSVLQLFRKIHRTIEGMPMKHLGFSIFREHYALVKQGTRGSFKDVNYSAMINDGGRVYIHPELHDVLDQLGGLLIGQDSITAEWAEFTWLATKRSAPDSTLSKGDVISLLNESLTSTRDVQQVKRILNGARESSQCVWTGRQLNNDVHIDHALPFSLWKNNDLWNLLPVAADVNSKKSDRIPSPTLIENSSERIQNVWMFYSNVYGNQFYRELFEGLGVENRDGLRTAVDSLKRISEYLIGTRGYPKFE
jgi:hypothetical protein